MTTESNQIKSDNDDIEKESSMLKRLKSKYPDKEYPLNLGKMWTNKEDLQLLDELSSKSNDDIATIHGRTTKGITERIRFIVEKMLTDNISIIDIINKTGLTKDYIISIKEKKYKRDNNIVKKIKKTDTIYMNEEIINVEEEITNINKNITDINNNITKILKLLETFEII